MLIIGIAGGSGSGKTTVARKITEKMHDHVVVISQDSYYKDQSHLPLAERQALNFDHPNAIDWDLLVQNLRALKEGKDVEQPVYSYITCSRSTTETVHISPAPIIVVEGILIFNCKELVDELDIKVFVDADDDDRLMRVIARDIRERGKDVEWVMDRYTKTVKPMYLQFIEPSKRVADIIVPQGGHNRVAIQILTATIKHALKEKEEE
ncbi:MAG: uridine kinase [Bacteroidales bacterium]|nr:uridine kinase [Bacteroidales bacterium]